MPSARVSCQPAGVAGSLGRRIMYLGTGSLDQVTARNGVNLFLEGECSDFRGYFDQVWNVSFPAGQRKEWRLTDRHVLLDVDWPILTRLRRFGLHGLGVVLRELVFLVWAVRFVLRQRVDLIEATNPYLQGLNALILSLLCGVPYVILVTCNYDFYYRTLGMRAFPTLYRWRWLEKAVERVVFSCAAAVVADRQHYVDYGLANGARADRAACTWVVVDPEYYRDPSQHLDPRPELRLAGKLILLVGRLQSHKLPEHVIRAMELVIARRPDTHLLIAGEGELRPELERVAEELGLGQRVHFLGSVPAPRLAALMASVDVVASAHLGYSLIEAALCGAAIVTYDIDWHGEVIRDGETGLLAPFGDIAGLAERILRLLDDPTLARRLGRAIRDYALHHHRRDTVIPEYWRIYDRVFGTSSASPGAATPS